MSLSNFSNKVRILAKTSDCSLREIAQKSGITPSCLSRYFAGKAQLRADAFMRLLKTLGVDIEQHVDQRVVQSVEMSQPGNFEEALICAFNLLPSLTKRRHLRLLLRQLSQESIAQDRVTETIIQNLSHHCGSIDLRQEA